MSYLNHARGLVGLWYPMLIFAIVLVVFQLLVAVERLISTIPSKSDSSCSKTMLYLQYEPHCLARTRTGDFMIRLKRIKFRVNWEQGILHIIVLLESVKAGIRCMINWKQ